MRLFIDASVLISGILSSQGASSLILTLVKNSKLSGIVSENIISEVRSHLHIIHLNNDQLNEYVRKSGIIVRKKISLEECNIYANNVDKDDKHVVAGAIITGSTYIITLDKKHLLKENIKREYYPLKIYSPKEFCKKVLDKLDVEKS